MLWLTLLKELSIGCLSDPLLPAVDDVVIKYGETTVHDLFHKTDIRTGLTLMYASLLHIIE